MKSDLRKFIVDNFAFGQPVEFADGDSLQDAGIIDSTGVLDLVSHLEATYGISVEDSELTPENLDSVDRLARFVARKLAEAEVHGAPDAAPAPGAA